jgi:hypothetical protein
MSSKIVSAGAATSRLAVTTLLSSAISTLNKNR